MQTLFPHQDWPRWTLRVCVRSTWCTSCYSFLFVPSQPLCPLAGSLEKRRRRSFFCEKHRIRTLASQYRFLPAPAHAQRNYLYRYTSTPAGRMVGKATATLSNADSVTQLLGRSNTGSSHTSAARSGFSFV